MLFTLICLEFTTKVMTHNGVDISMNFVFENRDPSVRTMDLEAPLNSHPTYIF